MRDDEHSKAPEPADEPIPEPADRPATPMDERETCDWCGSTDLWWRNCKLLCRNCSAIVKSCGDL
jgi:hypothetical protein